MTPKFLFLLTYIIVHFCSEASAYAIKVNLTDVGFNGTWDDFCDSQKAADEFAEYPNHDVRRYRRMLCLMKENNKIERSSIQVFAAYKYCLSIRPQIEYFYKQLRTKFDEHIANVSGEMPTTARPTDECYTKTVNDFHRECVGKLIPCTEMFQSMLSAVCVKAGITSQDISRYIVDVCSGKYMSDNINWPSIISTIKFAV